MKVRHIALVAVALVTAALLLVGSASASTGTYAVGSSATTDLATQSSLGTTSTFNADGSGVISMTSLDTAATSGTVLSDGYICGTASYRAVVKWVTLWGQLVSWTWDMHFGVKVCHDKVTGLDHLYASVDSEIPTWSYCGVVYRYWGINSGGASAHGNMEGCFDLYDKIVVEKLPWAKIVIGGNGNLWDRQTGIN